MAFFVNPSPADPHRRSDVLMATLLAAGFFVFGLAHLEHLSIEGTISEALARELWYNTTIGRQALVSSLWWPPIPTLLRLPLTVLVGASDVWPIPSLLLSSLAAGAACGGMARRLRAFGLRCWAWPTVLIVAAHPFFLEQATGGGSAPLVLLLAWLAADGLADWAEHRALRALVALAFGTAILIGSSADMAPWVLLLHLMLALDLGRGRFAPGQRTAAWLLAALPSAALTAFWLLMNRLIMGDALYFVRGALRHRQLLHGPPVLPFPFSPLDAMVVAIALFTAAWAGLGGRRGHVLLAMMAGAPIGLAAFLFLVGFPVGAAPLMFIAGPLTLMALAREAGARRRVSAIILAALALTMLAWLRWPERSWSAPDRRSQNRLAQQRGAWLPRLESHVRAITPHAKVFVAGFDAFTLLDRRASDLFVPTLDFDIGAVERAYAGNRLYLLVRRPEGRGALDSIYWKYPRIYERGSRHTLYDSDWGDWRLFEIIQLRPEEALP